MSLPEPERHKLIQEHLGFSRAMAFKIRDRHGLRTQLLDEMIAAGNAGLVEAAERWDPERGVAFTTFAHYRVRGAIYDALRQQGLFSRRASLRFDAGADAVMQDRADNPSSEQGGGKAARVERLAGALNEIAAVYVMSLDADDRPEPVSTDPPEMEQIIDEQEARSDLTRALRQLPERERRLVRLHYYRHLSLAEAGAKLGLSRSWACRLHARAVRRLADMLSKQE